MKRQNLGQKKFELVIHLSDNLVFKYDIKALVRHNSSLTVKDFKRDFFNFLKTKDIKDGSALEGKLDNNAKTLQNIIANGAEFYSFRVRCCSSEIAQKNGDEEQNGWLRKENELMKNLLFGVQNKSFDALHLELIPRREIPAPTLRIKINGNQKIEDGSQSYTVYFIQVVYAGLKWLVSKRYSQFLELHLQLERSPDIAEWVKQNTSKQSTVSHGSDKQERCMLKSSEDDKQKRDNLSDVGRELFTVATSNRSSKFIRRFKPSSSKRNKLPLLPPKEFMTSHSNSKVRTMKRQKQLEEYLQSLLVIPPIQENPPYFLLSFLGVMSSSHHDIVSNSLTENKNVIHAQQLQKVAKSGDVVLFKNRTSISKIQRKLTRSNWNHVGIVLKDPSSGLKLLEATSDGVICSPLLERLENLEMVDTIAIRHLYVKNREKLSLDLFRFAQNVKGKPYSLTLRKLVFSSNKNNKKSTDTDTAELTQPVLQLDEKVKQEQEGRNNYFCSELVADALYVMGCLSGTKPSNYYWPSCFEEGREIDKSLFQNDAYLSPIWIIDTNIAEVHFSYESCVLDSFS